MTVRPQYVYLLIQYDQISLRVINGIITDESPTTNQKWQKCFSFNGSCFMVIILCILLLSSVTLLYLQFTKSFTKSFSKIINCPESQEIKDLALTYTLCWCVEPFNLHLWIPKAIRWNSRTSLHNNKVIKWEGACVFQVFPNLRSKGIFWKHLTLKTIQLPSYNQTIINVIFLN